MSERPPIAVWRDTLRDSKVDRTAKLVGFVLSTYWGTSGTCWPARRTIAAGGSISVRAADTAIAALERARFLAVSRSKGRTSNTYALTLPTAQAATLLEALTAQPGALLGDVNGAKTDGQRRSQRHPKALRAKAKTLNLDADASQRESAPAYARSQSKAREAVTHGDLSIYDG